jgi:hypothetical protein
VERRGRVMECAHVALTEPSHALIGQLSINVNSNFLPNFLHLRIQKLYNVWQDINKSLIILQLKKVLPPNARLTPSRYRLMPPTY